MGPSGVDVPALDGGSASVESGCCLGGPGEAGVGGGGSITPAGDCGSRAS